MLLINLFESAYATIYQADPREIVACNNPLNGWEWDCRPVSQKAIEAALAEKRYRNMAWQQVNATLARKDWETFHAERVAYLIDNPDDTPIEISAEEWPFPGTNKRWPQVVDGMRLRIIDGSHRVAAASLRGDASIKLHLAHRTTPDDLRRLLPSLR